MDAEEFISGTTLAAEPLIADGSIPEAQFLTSEPLVRAYIAWAGASANPSAWATLYRRTALVGLVVSVLYSLAAHIVILARLEHYECNARCALVISAQCIAVNAMITTFVVCHQQVRRIVASGSLRLLVGELPREERERVLRKARTVIWRWFVATVVVYVSYVMVLVIWYLGGSSVDPEGVNTAAVLDPAGVTVVNVFWGVYDWVIYPVGCALGLPSLSLAVSMLSLTSESLRAMFRHFRGELCRGAVGSPSEALQHYLRLRGNTKLQVERWQFTAAWLLVAPLLWSVYLTLQVVFDGEHLVWTPFLIYVMYVSLVPITMHALARVAGNVDSLCEAMTAAQVFSAAERQLLKSDLRDVPAEFTVYGLKVDRTVLAAAALGLLSSLGQGLIDVADG